MVTRYKFRHFLQNLGKDEVTTYQYLQAIRMISLILTGIALVRLGIDLNNLSAYEWVLFLVHAVSYFWSMGLKNSMMNFYPKLSGQEKTDFFSTLLMLFVSLGVASGGVLTALHLSGLVSVGPYIWFIIGILLLNTIGGLVEHVLLLTERSQELFRYASWSYFSYPIVVIAAFHYSNGSMEAVFSSIIIWGVIRLFWIHKIRDLLGGVNTKLLWSFLAFAFPLVIHVLLGNGMEFVDGFLVKYFFTEADFAIFRYGARELPLNSILITSMVIALIPKALTSLHETLAVAKSRLEKLMHWIMPISIILVLSSKWLFTTIYDESFLPSAHIFNVYLLIILTRMWVPQLVLYAQQNNRSLMYITFVELAVNIGLSLIMLEYYGLIGIAFATLIAYVIQKALLSWYAWRRYNLPVYAYLPVKSYAIYSLLLVVAFIYAW